MCLQGSLTESYPFYNSHIHIEQLYYCFYLEYGIPLNYLEIFLFDILLPPIA